MRDLVGTLCEASRRRYSNPYEALEWPERLEPERWYLSPELLSLHGTEAYEQLGEGERRRLSFFEAVNFFSLNVHGEKALVEGLARRLYRLEELSPYLHHFLDEENKHMVLFGGFCERYAGKVYPDRKVAWPREYAAGEEDFLFFAKVLVFEELVDAVNRRVAADPRVEPISRTINRLHHHDEARHLAFGREVVRRLFGSHAPSWSPETLAGARAHLAAYFGAAWKEHYNPDAYADAGLAEPYELARLAWEHPSARERRRELSARCVGFLKKSGILLEDPSL